MLLGKVALQFLYIHHLELYLYLHCIFPLTLINSLSSNECSGQPVAMYKT